MEKIEKISVENFSDLKAEAADDLGVENPQNEHQPYGGAEPLPALTISDIKDSHLSYCAFYQFFVEDEENHEKKFSKFSS